MDQFSVFISYSHVDEDWKDRLITHLGVLQKEGYIYLWDDRLIDAGDDWRQNIVNAMNEAVVAILLVSANFLTSAFILEKEVPQLLERRKNEGLKVIPVIVKPCAWQQVGWLTQMQVRPNDGRALSSGNENQIDTDLSSIAEEVVKYIEPFMLPHNIETSSFKSVLMTAQSQQKGNCVLQISLSLFDEQKFEEVFVPKVKKILEERYEWNENNSQIAMWAMRELVDNAFIHGCQGRGELKVSIFVRIEANGQRLIVRVKSPGSGFNFRETLNKIINSSKEDVTLKSGLLYVYEVVEKLISSTDGLTIQANILKNTEAFKQTNILYGDIELNDKKIDILEIQICGNLSSRNTPIIEKVFWDKCASIECIGYIINLEECPDIRSVGFRFLLKLFKISKEKSRYFCVIGVQGYIKQIFDTSGHSPLYKQYDSINDAIKSIKSRIRSDNSSLNINGLEIGTIVFNV